MKRLGNIYKDVVDVDLVISDIIDGTKFKRGKRKVRWLLHDQSIVKEHPELYHQIDRAKARKYAQYLVNLLESGAWRHKKPRHLRRYCQNRTHGGGKWRNLSVPCLDDHIIAHMVVRASERAFMRGMHPHCCGSVPGRGIKHVVKTVSRWLKGDKECRYFVKLDIRHFFENIDRRLMKATLRKVIKDKQVLDIFDQIIDSDDTACPIGYYTSPWFANLFLQDFDHFIEQGLYKERRGKRIKYARHYLRYVDDMLLVGTCKGDLLKAIKAIKRYLMDNYGLEIKDNWEIKAIGKHEIVDGKWRLKPGTYWCDIGGYKFCKDSVILRDGIYLSTTRLVRRMAKKGYYALHDCESLNSRIGWSMHCDNHNLLNDKIKPYVDLDRVRKVVSICGQGRKTAKLLSLPRSNIPETT